MVRYQDDPPGVPDIAAITQMSPECTAFRPQKTTDRRYFDFLVLFFRFLSSFEKNRSPYYILVCVPAAGYHAPVYMEYERSLPGQPVWTCGRNCIYIPSGQIADRILFH